MAAGRRDGDVSRADEARALVERAASELGGLDVVVNGASSGLRAGGVRRCLRGAARRRARRDGEGHLLRDAGRGAALTCEPRPGRDGRGRRRLPAVAVVRRALRGEGGAGDADAGARAGARAGRPGVRRRAGSCRRRAGTGWSGGRPRRRSDGRAHQRTSPRRSSIWPAPRSSPGRPSWSTAADCCKPGAEPLRRTQSMGAVLTRSRPTCACPR